MGFKPNTRIATATADAAKRYHMTEAAKKARAQYAKEWRRKNPDKQKAITERYWEKKARELEEKAAADPAPDEGEECQD